MVKEEKQLWENYDLDSNKFNDFIEDLNKLKVITNNYLTFFQSIHKNNINILSYSLKLQKITLIFYNF